MVVLNSYSLHRHLPPEPGKGRIDACEKTTTPEIVCAVPRKKIIALSYQGNAIAELRNSIASHVIT